MSAILKILTLSLIFSLGFTETIPRSSFNTTTQIITKKNKKSSKKKNLSSNKKHKHSLPKDITKLLTALSVIFVGISVLMSILSFTNWLLFLLVIYLKWLGILLPGIFGLIGAILGVIVLTSVKEKKAPRRTLAWISVILGSLLFVGFFILFLLVMSGG